MLEIISILCLKEFTVFKLRTLRKEKKRGRFTITLEILLEKFLSSMMYQEEQEL